MSSRFIVFLVLVLLWSCGYQKKLSEAKQTAATAKEDAGRERVLLESIARTADSKLDNVEIDSVIKDGFDEVLAKLNRNLNAAEKRVAALEEFIKEKSNFRSRNYRDTIAPLVSALDSFNVLREKRERIYSLVHEATVKEAFHLYNMAAFFKPGIYQIPASALGTISRDFLPAIDSIISLANDYTDVPRTVRLVFVGHADESPVAEGGALYNNLRRFTPVPAPGRAELNRVLSHLRANEVMRNMKIVMGENNSRFTSRQQMGFSYFSYGRGEAYPSPKIKDYQKDDERRRIVMFYWAVLPNVKYLD